MKKSDRILEVQDIYSFYRDMLLHFPPDLPMQEGTVRSEIERVEKHLKFLKDLKDLKEVDKPKKD